MPDATCRLRFEHETCGHRFLPGDLGGQDLDRELLVNAQVEGAIHGAHTAAPDLLVESIFGGQDLADATRLRHSEKVARGLRRSHATAVTTNGDELGGATSDGAAVRITPRNELRLAGSTAARAEVIDLRGSISRSGVCGNRSVETSRVRAPSWRRVPLTRAITMRNDAGVDQRRQHHACSEEHSPQCGPRRSLHDR